MSAIDYIAFWRLRPRFIATIAGCAAVVGIGAAGAAADLGIMSPSNHKVAPLLKARLPRTDVSKVDCGVVDGLCEVTAGSNLFYVDRSGRYLMIGRVYDMETRQDLTATRLLEINPDTLIGGAAKATTPPAATKHR
jgi:thiol:disulfide interchange protein DsbC